MPEVPSDSSLPPLPRRGTTAEDLRERMAGVRSSLETDVATVTSNAKDLTDWRYYVRQHPVALAGAAVVAGYLLVPRRTEVVQPSAKELAKLARNEKVYVSNKPQQASRDRSLFDKALSVAAVFATRAATAYVSQKLGKVTGKAAEQKADA